MLIHVHDLFNFTHCSIKPHVPLINLFDIIYARKKIIITLLISRIVYMVSITGVLNDHYFTGHSPDFPTDKYLCKSYSNRSTHH